MKHLQKMIGLMLAVCLLCGLAAGAGASTFTDAHGNVIELDDSLEAYTDVVLVGTEDAARKGETNLGDLWTDALRWFAVSGKINEFFEEDDVTAGITEITVDADHIVALWNGGNLKTDIPEGKFGSEQLAEVLPYPNTVAISYLTGAQLLEQLEAASQGLPYSEETAAACASFMQVSGLKYTVDTTKAYDRGEAYGESGNWFRAASLSRVTIDEVNGQPFDPEAVYAVITSNANAKGGMDASYVFKSVAELEDEKTVVTTAVVREVIWQYISGELENRIGEAYAEAQGRIVVK
jgi:5'-nucleotidase